MSAASEAGKLSVVSVFLFGKPAWEIDLEMEDVDERMVEALENLGDELRERLHNQSRIIKLLLDNGWSGAGGLYDVSFYKDLSPDEARKELASLGIDPRDIDVIELPEDEE